MTPKGLFTLISTMTIIIILLILILVAVLYQTEEGKGALDTLLKLAYIGIIIYGLIFFIPILLAIFYDVPSLSDNWIGEGKGSFWDSLLFAFIFWAVVITAYLNRKRIKDFLLRRKQ